MLRAGQVGDRDDVARRFPTHFAIDARKFPQTPWVKLGMGGMGRMGAAQVPDTRCYSVRTNPIICSRHSQGF